MTADNGRSVSHRTAMASIWMIVGRLGSRVVDLLSMLLLARLLQPADFGLVAIALSLILIVEAVLELPVAQILLVEPEIDRPKMDTAFTLSVLRGVVLGAAIGALAWPLAKIYHDARLLPLALALALAPMIRGIQSPRLTLYGREFDFRRQVVMDIVAKSCSLALSTGVAIWTHSYWALACVTVTSPVIATILSFLLAPYRPKMTLSEWRMFRAFVGWLTAAQLFAAISWQYDRLVLGHLTPGAPLGQFSIADQLAQLPGQVLLIPLLAPLSTALAAVRHDPVRLRQAYVKAIGAISLIGFPTLVGMALLSGPIVAIGLGSKWHDAAPVLQWLALAAVPALLWMPLNALAITIQQPELMFWRHLTSFLIMIVLVTVLAWWFLIPGVAVARATCSICITIMGMFSARRAIGIGIFDQIKASARAGGGCLAMSVVVGSLMSAVPDEAPFGVTVAMLIALAGLGALVYTATVALLWRLAGAPDGGESVVLVIVKRRTPPA